MSFQTIRNSFFLLSFATILCRIFGFVREIITAKFFGTTGIYDAFLIAFMIPNFFRGLLAEGALSTAFVPVLSELIAKGEDRQEILKISGAVFTFFLIATTSLYILVLILSTVLLHFFTLPLKIVEIVSFLRFTFPYLIFVSLAAWAMGVLNVRHRFVLPGLSPIVFDFWWIVSLFCFTGFFGESLNSRIFGLMIGVLIGGASQFIFQVPLVLSVHGPIVLNTQWKHPAIIKMLKLFAPVVIGMSVGPINLLVDYSFARSLTEGTVSALWYATRIYQLPLGIFSISLATVLLPHMAGDVAKNNFEAVKENIHKGLEQTIFFLIPSAVGISIFRKEIVELIFKRGAFTDYSVGITAYPMMLFCIGLVFYGAAIIITRAFYAYHDTATPVKVGLISIATNALLDVILMRFMGHGGIALSTSFVGLENFLLLYWLFRRKFGLIEGSRITKSFFRVFSICIGWGIIIEALRRILSYSGLFITVCGGIVIAVLLYIVFAIVFRFPEIYGITRIFKWKTSSYFSS
ncbi:MAG: putative peptidoglycan biosynthesis protein MurJ [candidate division TA06 bacterium ADurb.Bin131]|jgi:putative peptidoglycan lipid II flippase|uniref:Probable lipid II flippase MurJ n=1 Tax=candidate division TA06 bacterium ADurb.Bin131 TaxID=1852827 RepID=A0A1V6C6U0_UNCT6|nr:MAG: putative peptidoglycan biosynthesis protein MurJ [candidate division TA06 bacterium ADurb.Bin131]HOC02670.1 murein biosynthesis integral membrane protein MurJ [bacterium]HON05725.1 murein biosynthesis integral membrane protein MurJ [bacterium]